jgi:ferric-dicitrate binding protein FerR (iron transport regulator)
MNLNDQEILELHELCNAVVDETISDSQKARLSRWLATSEEARQVYVRELGLSASLHSYASEMQAEAPDARLSKSNVAKLFFAWGFGSLATAAAIFFLVSVLNRPSPIVPVAEVKADELVAQLTASKECHWSSKGVVIQPGDLLRKGQRLVLDSGLAEITFDSGAQVVLEGPASLDVDSAWEATLLKGALKASVPPEAIGFRISNHLVEVVDLGTAFTMLADQSGATEVLVLKGAVEAEPRNTADKQTILLREKESRRFADTGVSSVSNSEEKFARYTHSLPLNRFMPATGYVHWSFDEITDGQIKADASGAPLAAFDAQLRAISESSLPAALSAGRRGNALNFDGHLFAKASFPGISGNDARTIAFWVKVRKDAQLSDAYAMVAWRAASKKLGSRPVHISWNRNPSEGNVGVLRTDYGGGYALGATSLRDGRWHHVAVVFVPAEEANTPVQVKQYVDGRFEGEGIPSAPGSKNPVPELGPEEAAAVNNFVWLGCRLGNSGPRKERFRGEIDELFIADRAIGPLEIVSLMRDNQPPPRELAAAR